MLPLLMIQITAQPEYNVRSLVNEMYRIHSFAARFTSQIRLYIINIHSQIMQKEYRANHIMHISNAGTNKLLLELRS
jgi:predicted DNA-binding ribbon-helix-helix protein